MHFLTTNSKINNQTHENCNEVQNADYELEQQRVLKKKGNMKMEKHSMSVKQSVEYKKDISKH